MVDWLLRRRQETSGKNQYVSAVQCSLKRWEQKSPCKAERNTRHPLATIHKHLGPPTIVVCSGPLHRIKSPETSERCRTVRAPCGNILHTPQYLTMFCSMCLSCKGIARLLSLVFLLSFCCPSFPGRLALGRHSPCGREASWTRVGRPAGHSQPGTLWIGKGCAARLLHHHIWL